MLMIHNAIVEPTGAPRRSGPIHTAVIHRLSFAKDNGGRWPGGEPIWGDVQPIPDNMLTAALVSQRFADTRRVRPDKGHYGDRPGRYTGGRPAYEIGIRADGMTEQMIPLYRYGAHALSLNPVSVGVAVYGDFTEAPPTTLQMHSLIQLCACFLAMGWIVVGHTESGQSKDPTKQCPGEYLDLNRLRRDSQSIADTLGGPESAKRTIEYAGLVGLPK